MACAIIVAAGKGTRMAADVRKPFLMLGGCPILGHSLKVFDTCDAIERIVVVVQEDDRSFCEQHVIAPLDLAKPIALIAGGSDRQASVYNGLQVVGLADDGIVVVHDGVRPFVNTAQIADCVQAARDHGACLLAIPSVDSLKIVDGHAMVKRSIPRGDVWLAQTPQAFAYKILHRAHADARRWGRRGTDDAMLVELTGIPAKIIPGSRHNLKITTRDDLDLARVMLRLEII